jgi:F0F1-type ATP synthase epsilon subunit
VTKAGSNSIQIDGGVVEVVNNKLILLAESAK